jgi:hypothetical protein
MISHKLEENIYKTPPKVLIFKDGYSKFLKVHNKRINYPTKKISKISEQTPYQRRHTDGK